MTETPMKQERVPEVEEKSHQEISPTSGISHASREPLWGTLLFFCILLFGVMSVGIVAWVVYSQWQNERGVDKQPSIASIMQQNEETETVSEEQPSATENKPETETADEVNASAKKLEISVLNGGAAKGSAGTLANFLKNEGYIKTDMGNTIKNYTGVTVYFASGLEREATVVKESVLQKYPSVKMLPADVQNKETAVSQVTIILGK